MNTAHDVKHKQDLYPRLVTSCGQSRTGYHIGSFDAKVKKRQRSLKTLCINAKAIIFESYLRTILSGQPLRSHSFHSPLSKQPELKTANSRPWKS